MRPSILNPLFATVASLPGIGPKNAKLLDRLLAGDGGEARALDLLFHLPYAAIDRRIRPKIAGAPLDMIVTLEVRVVEHRPPSARSKAPHKVLVEDDTGDVLLVFFLANPQWIERSLPVGATRWISGKLELWDGHRQIVHPDRVLDSEGFARMAPVEPVYPSTEGLFQKSIGRAVGAALAKIPALPEWRDGTVPPFAEALRGVHRPNTPESIAPQAPARMRLAYDELLASQLVLALMRAKIRRAPGRASWGDGRIRQKIAAALPF
ncbi:MAG: ATP-dependent DNA helicase RecG, partial [Beijerinckiaceae bacterium]